MTPKSELLPVVDPRGTVIGSASRAYCHNGSHALHPVVHLHVISPDGLLLMQRRSMSKAIQPGRWDTAVGGHVDYGETIAEALRREAAEETGIDASAATHLTSYVYTSDIETELIAVHYLVADPGSLALRPEPGEIDCLEFMSHERILQLEADNALTPNFMYEYSTVIRPLIKNITAS